MRQLRTLAFLSLALILLGAPSFAFSSKSGIATPSALTSTQVRQITLGNSTVPLDGLWKFRIGDNMAWAQPDFDNSAWGTMDLTPPGSYDPIIGSSGFVAGWTAHGYKGYSGYAWYRLRVNIQDGQSALVSPDVGGLHGPPVLGHASTIAGLLNLDWYAIDRSDYSYFLEGAILLLALLVAFALF